MFKYLGAKNLAAQLTNLLVQFKVYPIFVMAFHQSIVTGYAERPSYSAGSYKIVQSVDVSTNLCRALYAILFV